MLAKAGESAQNLDATLKKLGNTPIGQEAAKSAQQLEATLKNVTDQQQKLADRARLAATGLEALGGPAKLTTDQLNQMNTTILKGIDAFRALGQDVPPQLQKVAAAVQAQQQALSAAADKSSALSGVLGDLGGKFAQLAGPAAIGFAVKSALEYADTLVKMSDRTGIGVVALQKLEAIAKPSGNSIEELAQSINKFQKNLADGDKAASEAIGRIGLSVSQLKALSPDEQFIAIAKGIQSIKDPAEQTLIAVQLFGRGGAEILPSLKAKVDELKDSTFVMSETAVKALDDAGDAFSRLKTSGLNAVGELIAGTIHLKTAFTELPAQLQKALDDAFNGRSFKLPESLKGSLFAADLLTGGNLSRAINQAQQAPNPLATETPAVNVPLQGVTKELPGLPVDLAAAEHASDALTKALAAQQLVADHLGLSITEYAKKLDEANTKIRLATTDVGTLTEAQQAQAAGLLALGLSEDEIAVVLGRGTRAIHDYFDAVKAGANAEVEFLRKLDAQNKLEVDAENATIRLSLAIREHLLPNTVSLKDNLANVGTQLVIFSGENEALAVHLQKTLGGLDQLGDKVFASNFKVKQGHDGYAQWAKDLSELTSAFAHLSQIADGSLGDVVRDIGNVIGSLNLVTQSIKQFKTEGATTAGKVAAGVSAGAGVLQATGSGSRGSRIAGGALTGAAIGSVIPGVGTAIGAGVGALIGFARSFGPSDDEKNARTEQSQFLNTLRQQLGAASAGLSDYDVLLQTVGKSMGQLGKSGEETRQVLAGLLDTRNSKDFEAALGKAQSFLDRAADIKNQVTGNIFGGLAAFTAPNAAAQAKAADLQGQLATEQDPTKRADLTKQLSTQQSIIGITGVSSQGTAAAAGAALAGGVSKLQEQGVPITDILKQIGPIVSNLQEQFAKAGFSGGAAFDLITREVSVANDAVAGPAISAINGLGQALAGLSNTGLLTQDAFTGLGDQAADTFNKLVSQGTDGDTALHLMQPTLQTLYELQQKFGFTVDDGTQALINQGVQAGIVGEDQKSAADQTLDVLKAIATFMGVTLPGEADKGRKGVQDALNKIKAPDLTVKVGFDDGGGYHFSGINGGGAEPDPYPNGAATGGIVMPGGIQRFASGGRVLPFLARGTDTVPAMLTPGEWVLTAAQQKALASTLATPVEVHVDAPVYLDGQQIAVNTVTRIIQDKRGIGRALKRAVS